MSIFQLEQRLAGIEAFVRAFKSMSIDDTGTIPDPATGSSNAEEASNKAKASSNKKVPLQFQFSTLPRANTIRFKTPEKRPEVRLLEYSQVPGITITPRFQKFLSSKKVKTDHLNSQVQQSRPCKSILSSISSSARFYFFILSKRARSSF